MKPYLVGEGQLANAIAKHFNALSIDFVWYKKSKKNKYFSSEDIKTNHLYLLAIQDSKIDEFLSHFSNHKNEFLITFSGSFDIKSYADYTHLIKLHPMMTFTKNSLDQIFNDSPFLYEHKEDYSQLIKDSLKITKLFNFKIKSSEAYHMLGVFASNFQIALFKIVEDLAEINEINKDEIRQFIKPIVLETINNISNNSDLYTSLSGPAKRNDLATIKKHETFLEQFNPEYKIIYEQLTKLLFKLKK